MDAPQERKEHQAPLGHVAMEKQRTRRDSWFLYADESMSDGQRSKLRYAEEQQVVSSQHEGADSILLPFFFSGHQCVPIRCSRGTTRRNWTFLASDRRRIPSLQ